MLSGLAAEEIFQGTIRLCDGYHHCCLRQIVTLAIRDLLRHREPSLRFWRLALILEGKPDRPESLTVTVQGCKS